MSACPVCALTFESLDLETSLLASRYIFRTSMSRSRSQCQGHTIVQYTCVSGLPSTEKRSNFRTTDILRVRIGACSRKHFPGGGDKYEVIPSGDDMPLEIFRVPIFSLPTTETTPTTSFTAQYTAGDRLNIRYGRK